MRKIIVLSFITLDGVMQGPGGPTEDTSGNFTYGGWTVPYFDDFLGQTMAEQMSRPFDLLLGRKTFEIFASYWPHHEDEWPGINKATKYVVSNTLTKHEWCNSVFLKGNVVDEIKKLKQQEGPDLQVYGSGNLIQTLLKHDLVDELWLRIFPITLGPGKRLFAEGTMPVAFSLHEAKTSPRGVIVASYKRRRSTNMKIHRIDHVGIIVNDLPAAKAFFLDLGLEMMGEGEVEGEWAERIIGLQEVKAEVAMLRTPDGETNVELSKFHSPTDENGIQHPLANTLGIRHVCFAVEDIEAIVAKLKKNGAELVGEIQTYENTYKLCYIREPEGIILELAEQLEN